MNLSDVRAGSWGRRLRGRASPRLARPRLCFAFACVAVLLLESCTTIGPNYIRPAAIVSPEYKEIKGWKLATPRDRELKDDWWTVFHDRELTGLESLVAASNQSVKAREAAYREALDLINAAAAGLYPTVEFSSTLTGASSSVQQQIVSTPSSSISQGGGSGALPTAPLADREAGVADRPAPGIGSAKNSSSSPYLFSGMGSASWTLDIWGKTRREIEAQESNAEQNAADLANAILASQSALALAYVELRQADSERDLLEEAVGEYQRALDVIKNQTTTGVVTPLDYIAERTQLLAAQAQLVHVGVSRDQSEHAIAVLIGRTPYDLTIPRGRLAATFPSVPVAMPATLLERRPDIAAAERAMQAANAAIGVQTAGYYPDISIFGDYGASLDPLHGIGSASPVWDFGLNLTQPLFEGGLIDANVAAAREAYRESVATYRETVLSAIQQVEDQLSAIRTLNREHGIVSEQAAEAARGTEIALNEYRAGAITFTSVLSEQQAQLTARLALLTTRAALEEATVNLIVALGGGWNVGKSPDVVKESRNKDGL